MSRSKRDPKHIEQYEHDEASDSKKVKIVATEMNIELDHTDGDSVTSHPAKLSASVTGVDISDNGTEIIPPLDCSSIRKVSISVVGSGSVIVFVSPVDDGDVWKEVVQSDIIEICSRRIKIKSIDIIGDVHLVGRS